jgi:hypothetical protein
VHYGGGVRLQDIETAEAKLLELNRELETLKKTKEAYDEFESKKQLVHVYKLKTSLADYKQSQVCCCTTG